ncbi:MAG: hypothetical protein U0573_15050 [Phycisphaerales bacterium]|nr:hypothetical protein [Planctomycetota bacterium]
MSELGQSFPPQPDPAADQPAPAPPEQPEPAKRRRRPIEWLRSELAIFSGTETDRWAHRRGEPRTFAFLWAIFLMLSSIIALGVVLAGGIISLDAYQPLSRGLLITLTVGVLVFWPVIRLSQESPEELSTVAVLKDLAIVLIPMQAVVWPQMYLARWNIDVVAATSAAITAWALLVGGLLAIAIRPSSRYRTGWMVVFLGLAFAGVAISVVSGAASADVTRPLRSGAAPALVLASGVGLVADIAADRSWAGTWAMVYPAHWYAIAVTLAAASIAWITALAVCRTGAMHEYHSDEPALDAIPAGITTGNIEESATRGDSIRE